TLSSLTAAKTASTAKRAMVPTLTIIRARIQPQPQLQAEVLRAKELVDAPATAPGHLSRARTRATFDADFVSGPASMCAVWAAVGRSCIALDRSLPPPSRNHTRYKSPKESNFSQDSKRFSHDVRSCCTPGGGNT